MKEEFNKNAAGLSQLAAFLFAVSKN